MDIFVEKISGDLDSFLKFKKKEISNLEKLKAHCFAYFMLDKILKEKYGIENRKIIFENGKPFLESREIYFSISHSGDYVALCFSKQDCGIDIEKIIPRNFEKIAKKMGFIATTLEDFYYNWTKYEAEYKLGHLTKNYISKKYENYIISAVN